MPKYHHRVAGGMMDDYDRKMDKLSTNDRNFVKEVMAEQYMEKTANQRGLKVTVTPADKGHRGGPDASMRSRGGQTVRGEAKAEGSRLSAGQRNPDKTLVIDNSKSENAKGQFSKASGLDRQAAQQTRASLERGQSVRYEVSNTKRVAGGFETKVSGRNYMSRQTGTQGGPVTTTKSAGAIGSGFKPAVQTSIGIDKKGGAGGPGGGM